MLASGYKSRFRRIVPFVNWAGGKSQLLPEMEPYFPKNNRFSRYVEPFLGGGATFFALQPRCALLGDSNEELINCYKAIRDNVESVIQLLSRYDNSREHYYAVRQLNPESMEPITRAARLIYLNKTCYNGVYRVNLNGKFNVPYGNRNAKIYDADNLRRISSILKGVDIVAEGYDKTLEKCSTGDFVYLDPPYNPLSKTANFTKYTKQPFDNDDQLNLSSYFARLTILGCKVMLSNSDTSLIRQLYSDYHIIVLSARRYVNSDPNGRKAISELLILNYDPSND